MGDGLVLALSRNASVMNMVIPGIWGRMMFGETTGDQGEDASAE